MRFLVKKCCFQKCPVFKLLRIERQLHFKKENFWGAKKRYDKFIKTKRKYQICHTISDAINI